MRTLKSAAIYNDYFRRGDSGKTLFFPLGVGSRTFKDDQVLATGYVVPSQTAAYRLIKSLQIIGVFDIVAGILLVGIVVWTIAFSEAVPTKYLSGLKVLGNALMAAVISSTWLQGHALKIAVRNWEKVETSIPRLEWRESRRQNFKTKDIVIGVVLMGIVLAGIGYYQLLWLPDNFSILHATPLTLTIPLSLFLTAILLNKKAYHLSFYQKTMSVPIAARAEHRRRLWIAIVGWGVSYAAVNLLRHLR